jgi:hypothetical protein
MANGRNDVAHGKLDPILFGRSKSVQDIQTMLKRLEEIVEHSALAADDYLSTAMYLR